jgi:hypothetical protein
MTSLFLGILWLVLGHVKVVIRLIWPRLSRALRAPLLAGSHPRRRRKPLFTVQKAV